MKDLNICDLVEVRLWHDGSGGISVAFEPLDPTQNVVIDETAMATLNDTLSERLAGHSVSDPNSLMYIKEFCHKWLSEFYASGYVLLERVKMDD